MPQYKSYPEYKDSEENWLGSIPRHWKTRKVKFLFNERSQKGFPDLPLLAATQTKGVVPKAMYENRTVIAQKDLHLLKLVEQGDFVISLRSFQGGIELAHYRGIISPAYTVMIPSQELFFGYIKHFFKSGIFVKSLRLYVTGIREGQNIDYFKFKNSLLPIPAYDEQIKIAQYLDAETRKINRFIRNKQKLIALLKEQKQNIINQAVTRGIDPNVRLKPSGIEWLGDIPEHWEIKPAKCYFFEIDKRSETGNEELLSVSHITGITPRSEKNVYMFKASSYIGYKLCTPGDIAVNTMWAWMAALGVSSHNGIISSSYHTYRRFRRDYYDDSFLDFLLRSPAYLTAYNLFSKGITRSRLRLYPESFLKLSFVRPPLEEQETIVQWIEKETTDVNSAILKTEAEITLMQEYRTRLISDVVTGKIDVRDIPVESSTDPDILLEDIELDEDEALEGEEELAYAAD